MVPGTKIFDNFLGESVAAALLDHAISRPDQFEPSTVGVAETNRVLEAARTSSTFRGDWGDLKRKFSDAIKCRLPEILAATGVANWSPKKLQIDLAVHRDGDFFSPHVDTATGHSKADIRMVSAVYYFHRQPKTFFGGELAIRDLRGGMDHTITPLHDQLIVFPSFLPHEVKPVSVPGDEFADARFSINCWLNRAKV